MTVLFKERGHKREQAPAEREGDRQRAALCYRAPLRTPARCATLDTGSPFTCSIRSMGCSPRGNEGAGREQVGVPGSQPQTQHRWGHPANTLAGLETEPPASRGGVIPSQSIPWCLPRGRSPKGNVFTFAIVIFFFSTNVHLVTIVCQTLGAGITAVRRINELPAMWCLRSRRGRAVCRRAVSTDGIHRETRSGRKRRQEDCFSRSGQERSLNEELGAGVEQTVPGAGAFGVTRKYEEEEWRGRGSAATGRT